MLSAYANQLTALPASLGQLTHLTALSVGKNHLTALPESLWQLTNLHTFNVSDNHWSSLSEHLGNLTHLQMLDVGHNALTCLPESLGNLRRLTFLYVRHKSLNWSRYTIGTSMRIPPCCSMSTRPSSCVTSSAAAPPQAWKLDVHFVCTDRLAPPPQVQCNIARSCHGSAPRRWRDGSCSLDTRSLRTGTLSGTIPK
jgi:hypothetical protein